MDMVIKSSAPLICIFSWLIVFSQFLWDQYLSTAWPIVQPSSKHNCSSVLSYVLCTVFFELPPAPKISMLGRGQIFMLLGLPADIEPNIEIGGTVGALARKQNYREVSKRVVGFRWRSRPIIGMTIETNYSGFPANICKPMELQKHNMNAKLMWSTCGICFLSMDMVIELSEPLICLFSSFFVSHSLWDQFLSTAWPIVGGG